MEKSAEVVHARAATRLQAIHAGSPVAGTRLQRALRVQVLEGAAAAAAIGGTWAHVDGTSSLEVGHDPASATTKSKACSTTPLAAVSSGRTRFITSGVLGLIVLFLS